MALKEDQTSRDTSVLTSSRVAGPLIGPRGYKRCMLLNVYLHFPRVIYLTSIPTDVRS